MEEPISRRDLCLIEGCFCRLRVKQTIQFIKQSYDLEDTRLRTHYGHDNVAASVMACANFLAYHIGFRTELQVLVRKLLDALRRVCGASRVEHKTLARGGAPPSLQLALLFPRLKGSAEM